MTAQDQRTQHEFESLVAALGRAEAALAGRIDALDNRLLPMETALQDEVRAARDELKLHGEVLFEKLLDEIQAVGARLAALEARLEGSSVADITSRP